MGSLIRSLIGHLIPCNQRQEIVKLNASCIQAALLESFSSFGSSKKLQASKRQVLLYSKTTERNKGVYNMHHGVNDKDIYHVNFFSLDTQDLSDFPGSYISNIRLFVCYHRELSPRAALVYLVCSFLINIASCWNRDRTRIKINYGCGTQQPIFDGLFLTFGLLQEFVQNSNSSLCYDALILTRSLALVIFIILQNTSSKRLKLHLKICSFEKENLIDVTEASRWLISLWPLIFLLYQIMGLKSCHILCLSLQKVIADVNVKQKYAL